jgi:hypothetical protein
MDFSSSGFDIVLNDIPGWWEGVGIPGVTLGAFGTLFLTVVWRLGYGRWALYTAVASLLVAGVSITGLVTYYTHNATAKQKTLANVINWGENRYDLKIDKGQAAELVTSGSDPRDAWSGASSWSPKGLASTGNVAWLGKSDIASREGTVTFGVQLTKVNDDWFLIDSNKTDGDAEIKRR